MSAYREEHLIRLRRFLESETNPTRREELIREIAKVERESEQLLPVATKSKESGPSLIRWEDFRPDVTIAPTHINYVDERDVQTILTYERDKSTFSSLAMLFLGASVTELIGFGIAATSATKPQVAFHVTVTCLLAFITTVFFALHRHKSRASVQFKSRMQERKYDT